MRDILFGGISRNTTLALVAGCILFFGLNMIPLCVQGRADSLGNNSDGIYHYLKILRYRNELASNPAFDADVRLPTDQRLYACISWFSEITGIPIIRVLQILWFSYSLVFVFGAFTLAYRITGNVWGGTFFAASGWGFALAIGGHWGWDYSPFVPHDLATALVPWLILIWIRIRSYRHLLLFMVLLGMLTRIYPTTFVHLAGIFLLSRVFMAPKNVGMVVAAAFVFVLTVLPLALQWSGRGSITQDLLPLFRERFSYLAPTNPGRLFSEFKIFFMHLGLALIAWLIVRREVPPRGWKHIRFIAITSMVMALVGQIAVYSTVLAPLFISRASRFSYVWIFLIQARAFTQPKKRALKIIGVIICVLSLGLRPNLAGPLRAVVNGSGIGEAIDRYHVQDTNDFRDLCQWAAENTKSADQFITPPDDRYLFFRAYARRPVLILQKEIGSIHTPRPGLLGWDDLMHIIKRAYDARNLSPLKEIATRYGCVGILGPPEWDIPESVNFRNEAGWIYMVGTHNADVPGESDVDGG
jgi:hypothetical protein